jgi:hypothetical protein
MIRLLLAYFWEYSMFVMTGTIQGRTASLRWENGILSGDKIAMDKAQHENTQDHGGLGTIPAYTNNNYLARELPARALLKRHVFDSITHEENDDEPYNPNAVY